MGRLAASLLFMLCISSLVLAAETEKRFNIPVEGSPVLGPADAPVTIVEFLDYQ